MSHQTDTLTQPIPMPRHTHLLRRGSRYYVNVKVPKDLRAILKKEIIRKTLNTSDPHEAVRMVRLESLRVHADFENQRAKLRSNVMNSNTTGSFNIALGYAAGSNLTTGDNNIDIGNIGGAGEANTIRIGTQAAVTDNLGIVHPAHTATYIAGIFGATVTGRGGVGVLVDSNGKLGTVPSSKRFKADIKPMDKASEAILALKPVTFRYKPELDPDGIPQFGLVAEEVEKVNPDLVARDAKGEVYTVRYEAVNAMLLNEFLKEHRRMQEQEATITQLKSTVAQQQKEFHATVAEQQKEIKALTASVKEQASQIQKVSAQLEVNKAAPQTVLNDQ